MDKVNQDRKTGRVKVEVKIQEYYEITFDAIDERRQDLVIAVLSTAHYDGFEQTETSLKAYIPKKEFDEDFIKGFCKEQGLEYSRELIKEQNWNHAWESNFQPVVIEKFAAIRASFHKPVKNVEHEIVITPKMSFGTGHHATTYLMIVEMSKTDFRDKVVMDFGTGTGVLAILAEKLGARKIVAIDYDEWSIENASENIAENNCTKIELIKADSANIEGHYGIILANINRNVILENFSQFVERLEPGGILLLSGLLSEPDTELVSLKAHEFGFKILGGSSRNNWSTLRFTR